MASDPAARESKILAFLKETMEYELTLDTELIESGLMDSFKAATLVAYVESEFDVRIQPNDVTKADLATPRTICDLVARLAGNAPAAAS